MPLPCLKRKSLEPRIKNHPFSLIAVVERNTEQQTDAVFERIQDLGTFVKRFDKFKRDFY